MLNLIDNIRSLLFLGARDDRTEDKPLAGRRIPGAGRIRLHVLPAFTRELAAMLSAGLPVIEALTAAEQSTTHKTFKMVIRGIRNSIESGRTLTYALGQYPSIFDDMYISMLKAGEISGQIAEALTRLAIFLEDRADLRQQVRSAMIYPVIVCVLACLLTVGMLLWIVPAFERTYADLGGALPGPTLLLINLSHLVQEHMLSLTGLLILAGIGIAQARKTERGAYAWDSLMLQVPVFGELTRKVALSRFAASMAQMFRSGVPLVPALDIVGRVVGNRVMGEAVLNARETVQRGQLLSSAFQNNRHYPNLVIKLLSAGEKTGTQDEMLDKIASFYEKEVRVMLKGLTSLIEPMLITVLGLVIGGIVLCMFMPIFKMHEIVGF